MTINIQGKDIEIDDLLANEYASKIKPVTEKEINYLMSVEDYSINDKDINKKLEEAMREYLSMVQDIPKAIVSAKQKGLIL